MEIDTLEGIQLGGIPQWIPVRGADAANPVLLLMQQGPGLPMINEARRLERLLRLEETHDSLTAPSKQLVWFEKSAHTPHLEEPAKFRDLLMTVTANRLADP